MATLPRNLLRDSEAAIASYSWTDIAEATGYVTYYGFAHIESPSVGGADATTYALGQTAMYTEEESSAAVTSSESYTKLLDIDFDVTFNMPQNLKGKARFNYTVGADATGTANTAGSVQCYIKIRKVRDGTESEVADAVGDAFVFPAQTETFETQNTEVNIDTVEHYKKGDILRITFEVWGKKGGGQSARSVRLYYDPQNTTSPLPTGSKTTVMSCHVPFDLDL